MSVDILLNTVYDKKLTKQQNQAERTVWKQQLSAAITDGLINGGTKKCGPVRKQKSASVLLP